MSCARFNQPENNHKTGFGIVYAVLAQMDKSTKCKLAPEKEHMCAGASFSFMGLSLAGPRVAHATLDDR